MHLHAACPAEINVANVKRTRPARFVVFWKQPEPHPSIHHPKTPGGSLLRTAASWKSVKNPHSSMVLKSLNM